MQKIGLANFCKFLFSLQEFHKTAQYSCVKVAAKASKPGKEGGQKPIFSFSFIQITRVFPEVLHILDVKSSKTWEVGFTQFVQIFIFPTRVFLKPLLILVVKSSTKNCFIVSFTYLTRVFLKPFHILLVKSLKTWERKRVKPIFSFIVSFTYLTRVFLKSFHILVIKCQQSCPLPGGANSLQLSWVSLDFHIPIASKYKTLA